MGSESDEDDDVPMSALGARLAARAAATPAAAAAAPAAAAPAAMAAAAALVVVASAAPGAATAAVGADSDEELDSDEDAPLGDWLSTTMGTRDLGDPPAAATEACLQTQLAFVDAPLEETFIEVSRATKGREIVMAFGLGDSDSDDLVADWFRGKIVNVFLASAQQTAAGGNRTGKVNVEVKYRDEAGGFYHLLTIDAYGKHAVDGWYMVKK